MSAPDAEDDIAPKRPRWQRIRRRVTLVLAAVLGLALATLWSQRTPIAERFVERELAARGVRASYSIAQVAVRTQRVENLVLGDPAHPDLTARSVEVDIAYGGIIPRVGAIRARGVRIYGSLDNKGLHLGELDKFRDTTSTDPLALPDIDLAMADGRARLETPVGPVGLVINGAGNLRSGFAGKVAALVRDAAWEGCRAPQVSAYMDVRMANGSPRLRGPMRADALICGDSGAAKLAFDGDIRLARTLDHVSGRINGGAQAARGGGVTLADPRVDLRFDGGADGAHGKARVGGAALARGQVSASGTHLEGPCSWQPAETGQTRPEAAGLRADMALDAQDLRFLSPATLASMRRGGAGTPVAPLARRLSRALAGLQRDNRLTGRIRHAGGALELSAMRLSGGNGAHAELGDGAHVRYSLLNGQWALDGAITSGGGGLPEAAIRLGPGSRGGVSGQMFVQPYAAGSARLTLEPVRFVADGRGGTHIATRMVLDGPLADGAVRGLSLPLAADLSPSGDLVVNRACAPVAFASLSAGSLVLGPQRLTLCPAEGGALLAVRGGRTSGGGAARDVRLAGRLGNSPMRLEAGAVRFSLASGGFSLGNAKLTIGRGADPVVLAAARIDGGALVRGIGGKAAGIEAQIGTVPLLVREGDARWAFVDGALALKGRILVLDDANPDRFEPIESRDFRLTLANGRIDANGTLKLPERERQVAAVRLHHLLGSGVGRADFTLDNLRFDRMLQPDELTHIALGVVANVAGVVNGGGRIDWTPDHVTSAGDFSTEGLDLAAAFGPVQGLSTHIHFTDLLGLVTAPNQEMRIASVNPGVEVRDGVIRYALLSGQRVSIAGGRWPFAGGELLLLPTVMDMSAEKPRHMAFRVLGLDAAAFIQTLELENISATGTFDGLLPMVFDAQGGRIEGGILTARQTGMPPLVIDRVEGLDIPCDRNRQGGHLAYVGQVSNENLGKLGRMAFDALKDLQYKCLTILMDGAIDDEMVTQVAFNGVNRGELSTVPKPIASQFVGLPFIFNIRIEAPFRGLMNTARSFTDPSLLIRQQLGNGFTPVKENRLAVQPSESETMPSGERK